MKVELLNELLKAHEKCVNLQGQVPAIELVTFESGDMLGAVAGTPFRKFESVPQKKESKRKQNDSIAFDPYLDTLFDYPNIVKRTLNSPLDAIKHFNWHLTVQVPYCRFDCWHCYNPKGVCQTGHNIGKVVGETKLYTVEEILGQFVQIRKDAEYRGERYNVLRVSGGEPFLAPELIAGLLEEISNNPNPDYPKLIWTETNLSSWATTTAGDSLVSKAEADYYQKTGKRLTEILRTHADRIVVHPCFHGLSDDNLASCTGIKTGVLQFKDLISGFRALHGLQLHLYPTIISEASDPDHVEDLFNELYAIHQTYPLKLALIPLDYYPPTIERCKERVEAAGLYNRFACQQRWRKLLRRYYGVDYSQVPRPFVEGVNAFPKPTEATSGNRPGVEHNPRTSGYEPLLILLKSDLRPEYRQELLTILATPEGTRIRESYDMKHLEPSLRGRIGVETEAFCKLCPNVVVAYTNKQQSNFTCIPLREAKLVRIDKTESLVSFEMILGPYILPESQASAMSESDKGKECVNALAQRITEYFGVAHTLGKAGRSAWVLLGEQALLDGWDDGNSFRPLARNDGIGWGAIVNLLGTHDGAKSFFSERNIFLRLWPLAGDPASDVGQLSTEPMTMPPSGTQLTEGDKVTYRLSFYIPQFERYQSGQQKDELKVARTLRITSSTPSLVVEGYQPRPLPKYGEFDFVIRCSKLENDIPAQVIIEACDQSSFCPRIQLEFQLKKDSPSAF